MFCSSSRWEVEVDFPLSWIWTGINDFLDPWNASEVILWPPRSDVRSLAALPGSFRRLFREPCTTMWEVWRAWGCHTGEATSKCSRAYCQMITTFQPPLKRLQTSRTLQTYRVPICLRCRLSRGSFYTQNFKRIIGQTKSWSVFDYHHELAILNDVSDKILLPGGIFCGPNF